MYGKEIKALYRFHHAICFFSALALTFWCIQQYSKDDDITEVKFRKFHATPDDIYPSVSFCLTDPFVEDALKQYMENLTRREFRRFISGYGMCWDYQTQEACQELIDVVKEIDYDDVTVSLKDLIQNIIIQFASNNREYNDGFLRWNVVNDSLVKSTLSI